MPRNPHVEPIAALIRGEFPTPLRNSMELRTELHGPHKMGFVDFHGAPWNSAEFQGRFQRVPLSSMEFCRNTLGNPTEIHRIPP